VFVDAKHGEYTNIPLCTIKGGILWCAVRSLPRTCLAYAYVIFVIQGLVTPDSHCMKAGCGRKPSNMIRVGALGHTVSADLDTGSAMWMVNQPTGHVHGVEPNKNSNLKTQVSVPGWQCSRMLSPINAKMVATS
jgi:hypothetical protein